MKYFTLSGPFSVLLKRTNPSVETKEMLSKYDSEELARFWYDELLWMNGTRIYLCRDPGLREFVYLNDEMKLKTDFDCSELIKDFEERVACQIPKFSFLSSNYEPFIKMAVSLLCSKFYKEHMTSVS